MECTSPEARQWCQVDTMGHFARIGSSNNGTWFARAGCGALVCAEGTYDEACEAITAHRAEVREKYGVPEPEVVPVNTESVE